ERRDVALSRHLDLAREQELVEHHLLHRPDPPPLAQRERTLAHALERAVEVGVIRLPEREVARAAVSLRFVPERALEVADRERVRPVHVLVVLAEALSRHAGRGIAPDRVEAARTASVHDPSLALRGGD